MQIGNFEINKDSRTFIIAELSANHGGNLNTALKSVEAAAEAGADCIKLQTYRADTITLNSDKNDFIIKGTIWEGQNLYKLYEEAHTPWEWHEPIMNLAKDLGLECFSSPFDITAVDFLEKLNVPAYKIASFEITDIPLIEYVARKNKPIILSTGIATKEDIQLAIDTCKNAGNDNIALLRCTSSYPAPPEEANLKSMITYGKEFKCIFGLSDHTLGNEVALAATAMGAKIIEKHFILSKEVKSADSAFSLDPSEFKSMVDSVRNIETILGQEGYPVTDKMKKGRVFARSLYFTKSIKQNEIITKDHIKSIRPGYGLHPKYLNEVLGKKASKDFEYGDRVELNSYIS